MSLKLNKGRKTKQFGGEKHINAINKNGTTITFPNGFPILKTNGDYNIIHQYDPEEHIKNTILNNLEQLNSFSITFKNNSTPRALNGNRSDIGRIYNLYKSNQDDFDFLVHWLNTNK
jgi:hypothetical protein